MDFFVIVENLRLAKRVWSLVSGSGSLKDIRNFMFFRLLINAINVKERLCRYGD